MNSKRDRQYLFGPRPFHSSRRKTNEIPQGPRRPRLSFFLFNCQTAKSGRKNLARRKSLAANSSIARPMTAANSSRPPGFPIQPRQSPAKPKPPQSNNPARPHKFASLKSKPQNQTPRKTTSLSKQPHKNEPIPTPPLSREEITSSKTRKPDGSPTAKAPPPSVRPYTAPNQPCQTESQKSSQILHASRNRLPKSRGNTPTPPRKTPTIAPH
jgi:hypothetical protein